MKRFLIATIAASWCALVAGASTVAADGPNRVPLPIPTPQILTGSCSFSVRDDILTNGEVGLFFDNYIIVTGPLVVRLTNTESGTSLVENISGPAKVVPHSDGTATVYGRGAGLIPSPGHLWLVRGNSVVSVAVDGTQVLVSNDGTVEDLCGALS